MPNAQSKFVEVYRASHPLQAHAIKLALEEAGIPAFIENVGLQDGIGDLPCGWATAPRLMVEDTQVVAAQAVIEQTDHSRQTNPQLTGSETNPQLTGSETAVALGAGMLGLLGAALVGETPSPLEAQETTHCLACHAIMDESEETCPKCGWSYAQGDGLELFESEPPDDE